MAYEIKIYGEIIPFEDNWIIEQGGYSNLTDLQNQLKKAEGADVRVRINSCGGDCDTGFAMYAELRRYAKDNNANVETFGEARVASIATVIFLAGDKRTLTEHTEPFVHNAWTYTMGDSKQIMRAAVQLDDYNKKIANHYALHTDLSVDEALALMEAETAITTAEAKQMRFATDIEEVLRPVALKRFSNVKINKMSNKKGIMAKIAAIFEGIKNKKVFDAEQREVDFYELEEDEPIEVGANATIDGEPADGSIVMENGETYVFEAGVLMEIIEKDAEPAAEDDNEVEALKAKISELEGANASLTAKLDEKTVTNKTLRTALNNVRKLESEIVASEPAARPAKTVVAAAKGSRFGKALQTFETTNKK